MQVYLPNQKILETEEGCEAILQYVPDEDVKYEVRSKWGAWLGPARIRL